MPDDRVEVLPEDEREEEEEVFFSLFGARRMTRRYRVTARAGAWRCASWWRGAGVREREKERERERERERESTRGVGGDIYRWGDWLVVVVITYSVREIKEKVGKYGRYRTDV